MTVRYAVIGDPVEHSLSPAIFNAAFRECGIDAVYDAVRVRAGELDRALRALVPERAGFNVTTPLKEAILPYLDDCTDRAASARAANTVRVEHGRMTGHNTDGDGFIAAIAEEWELSPRGSSACFLGSGPAARAIALALQACGSAHIACWSRNASSAATIGPPPERTPDLVVSALPGEAEIPEAVLKIVAGARYVFDLNYSAARSPVPPEIGERRLGGRSLLLHQGALSFSWWTGVRAPIDIMRAALQGS